jgi:hypothetical protein
MVLTAATKLKLAVPGAITTSPVPDRPNQIAQPELLAKVHSKSAAIPFQVAVIVAGTIELELVPNQTTRVSPSGIVIEGIVTGVFPL